MPGAHLLLEGEKGVFTNVDTSSNHHANYPQRHFIDIRFIFYRSGNLECQREETDQQTAGAYWFVLMNGMSYELFFAAPCLSLISLDVLNFTSRSFNLTLGRSQRQLEALFQGMGFLKINCKACSFHELSKNQTQGF